jgi:hypothetical protein
MLQNKLMNEERIDEIVMWYYYWECMLSVGRLPNPRSLSKSDWVYVMLCNIRINARNECFLRNIPEWMFLFLVAYCLCMCLWWMLCYMSYGLSWWWWSDMELWNYPIPRSFAFIHGSSSSEFSPTIVSFTDSFKATKMHFCIFLLLILYISWLWLVVSLCLCFSINETERFSHENDIAMRLSDQWTSAHDSKDIYVKKIIIKCNEVCVQKVHELFHER